MSKEVHVLLKFAENPYGGTEIDTTSSSGTYRELSPFILGPIKAFAGNEAQNFENFWQYHKVYKRHVGQDGEPTLDWYEWHHNGFSNPRAVRYPMGKGAIPEYSFWHGKHLGYIEARKIIYASIYAEYVTKTDSFKEIERLYNSGVPLILRDYDAYDHIKIGMSLKDVINNPNRKCGHAFVLAMILTGQLEECLV